jgi:hypothetical protein
MITIEAGNAIAIQILAEGDGEAEREPDLMILEKMDAAFTRVSGLFVTELFTKRDIIIGVIILIVASA